MEKQIITEEMGIYKEWYEQARGIKTTEEAKQFADRLMNEYRHDYGTVCHAIASASLAMLNAMANIEGITGFQSSCITWEIIRNMFHIKGGAKLLDYENMLFPQYEYKFNKTITQDTFNWLQKEAESQLEDKDWMHPDVKSHMQSIVDGVVPFGYVIGED